MKNALKLTALAVLAVPASCRNGTATGEPARLLGAVSGNVSTFTMSPDGCTVSALFDNDRVQWAPAEAGPKGKSAKSQKRWLELALPASAAGATVNVDVRGSYIATGPRPVATALLIIAGQKTPIALPDGGKENEYRQRATMRIPPSALRVPVIVETSVEKPSDPATQVTLDVDSLDIALVAAPACRASG